MIICEDIFKCEDIRELRRLQFRNGLTNGFLFLHLGHKKNFPYEKRNSS
jgi:hypothetical protein